MATRKKISLSKPEPLESAAELRGVVALIAEDMLAERELKNRMDEELQSVRAVYDEVLADLGSQIEQRTELCAEFATQHPELFPPNAKSLDLGQAVIGFRTGTPKVKVLKRWTLAAALEAVKAKKWFQFVRTSEEVDKEAVIAARAEMGDKLATVGLSVIQDETFFVQPKLQEVSAGVNTAA
jgi:phage host-nuclease inhibitor protein Gam